MRREQENHWSALCHLCNAVPGWGMLFAGAIWFHLREESREVVAQARQAISFHGRLLAVLLIWGLLLIVARLLGIISPVVGDAVARVNNVICGGLLIAFIAVCFYGAAQCWSGLPFRYPLVRNRP